MSINLDSIIKRTESADPQNMNLSELFIRILEINRVLGSMEGYLAGLKHMSQSHVELDDDTVLRRVKLQRLYGKKLEELGVRI